MFFELLKDWNGHKPGARLAFSAADAAPLVAAGVLKAVEDDPLAPVIARGLESAMAGWMKGLDAVINQTLQKFAQAQTLSHKNSQPALFGPGNTGDPKKSFGDWALAVARNDRTYLEKHYGSKFNEWQQKAALGEASGVTGGYTVPPEFYQQLMTIMAEETFIRPNAFVVPMAGATLQIPYLDVSTVQSAGVSPFFGGVQMYWTAEAQTGSIAGKMDTVTMGRCNECPPDPAACGAPGQCGESTRWSAPFAHGSATHPNEENAEPGR